MLEIVDLKRIENKFGLLLSKLYSDYKLSCNEITELLINDAYFDFLEDQNFNSFLNESYENIIKNRFNISATYNEETLSEFYWAGFMYLKISLNKRIPLRQIILLCPLEKMINYYPLYHEMNDNELINKFLEIDYKTSILRVLRKRRKLTIRELSVITNIPEITLKYYEKHNNNLFNASFNNILNIQNALNYSLTYFYRYSKFVPFTYTLFEDKEMFEKLKKKLDTFYNNEAEYKANEAMLLRITNNKKEYVSDLFLSNAIRQILNEISETETLIY